MKFLLPFALVAYAQDGTCVAGLDPIGLEQTCLGRCHIYHAGEYGACNSYQVSQHDVIGPCGDTVQNSCISTFNAGWDRNLENCGNCYYVEMAYEDGTVRSTYIKTIDTNGSETKFEMGQLAWVNLCPYLCAGTGVCANKPEACPYGTLETTDMPAGCYVQNAPVTFKRVACDGSDGNGGSGSGGSGNENGGSGNGGSGNENGGSGNGGSGNENGGSGNGGSGNENGGSGNGGSGNGNEGGSGGNGSPGQNNISQCQTMVGNALIGDWDKECKSLCTHYASQPIHCPNLAIGSELAACVKRLHPYCSQM